MSKGPSGSTTTTTTNPVQQAQTPFLQNLWGNAQNIADAELTDPQGILGSNYNNYAQAAENIGQPSINAQSSGLTSLSNLTGGGGAIGTIGALGNQAGATVAPAQNLLMNNAATAATGNPALASLEGEAGGQYLSPSSNPYLAGTYAAAAQPVMNSFMTATAPQTDSNFEAAGRYGSGANANAQSVNQQNLGTTLNNLASNIYGNAYTTGLNNLTTAAGDLGSTYNSGMFNSSLAGNEAGTLGLSGLSTNIGAQGTGLNGLLNAIGDVPSLTSLPNTDIQNATNSFNIPLDNESPLLGNPVSGSSSTTSPFFSNPVANVLGTGLGVAGLSNATGVTSGLSSLFGKGSGLDALGTLI